MTTIHSLLRTYRRRPTMDSYLPVLHRCRFLRRVVLTTAPQYVLLVPMPSVFQVYLRIYPIGHHGLEESYSNQLIMARNPYVVTGGPFSDIGFGSFCRRFSPAFFINAVDICAFVNTFSSPYDIRLTNELLVDASLTSKDNQKRVIQAFVNCLRNLELPLALLTGHNKFRFPLQQILGFPPGRYFVGVNIQKGDYRIALLAQTIYIAFVCAYSFDAKHMFNSLINSNLEINVAIVNSLQFYRQHNVSGLNLYLASGSRLFPHKSWLAPDLMPWLKDTIFEEEVFLDPLKMVDVLNTLNSMYKQTYDAHPWATVAHNVMYDIDGGSDVTCSAVNSFTTYPKVETEDDICLQVLEACTVSEFTWPQMAFCVLFQPKLYLDNVSYEVLPYDSKLPDNIYQVPDTGRAMLALKYTAFDSNTSDRGRGNNRQLRRNPKTSSQLSQSQSASDSHDASDNDTSNSSVHTSVMSKIEDAKGLVRNLGSAMPKLGNDQNGLASAQMVV